MTDRLYRSQNDRVIAGVAGGLAEYLRVDPSIVRVAWVLLAFATGGIAALVYFVMMIVVPLPPAGWMPPAAAAPGGWASPRPATGEPADAGPGAIPGWQGTGAPTWGTPPAAGRGAGSAGIVFGAILILLGAWFLVREYFSVDLDLVWPFIIIGIGTVLIVAAMRRGRPA